MTPFVVTLCIHLYVHLSSLLPSPLKNLIRNPRIPLRFLSFWLERNKQYTHFYFYYIIPRSINHIFVWSCESISFWVACYVAFISSLGPQIQISMEFILYLDWLVYNYYYFYYHYYYLEEEVYTMLFGIIAIIPYSFCRFATYLVDDS